MALDGASARDVDMSRGERNEAPDVFADDDFPSAPGFSTPKRQGRAMVRPTSEASLSGRIGGRTAHSLTI